MRVYMSGPMFSKADVDYNLELADRLRQFGFDVYCPNESEPINDKARTDITARAIYEYDIRELEASNILLCQVSEDSGTNWEAGYFDCLARHVDPDRYFGIVGVATDIRLQTLPDPQKAGVDNLAGYVNPLVTGGLQRSLGVFTSLEDALDRLVQVRRDRQGSGD
ncbi:hypothetical protein BH23CHL5_BH23CHL5_13740 [soil metagenome]